MATLIDGKRMAADIRQDVRMQVEAWKKKEKRAPQLTAVIVGRDPSSCIFVELAREAAAEVGIIFKKESFDERIPEEELLKTIGELNRNNSVHGILILLPLPGHLNERRVCNFVSCDKDVDGLNERSIHLGMNALMPCAPQAALEMLIRTQDIERTDKHVVVVGRPGYIRPQMAMLMYSDGRANALTMDAAVTTCSSSTPSEELKRICQSADIIVTATGKAGLIKADMVKKGAAVIDGGFNQVKDPSGEPKWVGDVDFDEVRNVAGWISPVPGGVGPMTVAMLMKNTFVAAKNLA